MIPNITNHKSQITNPKPVSSRYRLIGEASTAALLFVLSPLAGYFLGKWLGEALGLGRLTQNDQFAAPINDIWP